MKVLVVVSALLAVAAGQYLGYNGLATPYAARPWAAAPYAAAPYAAAPYAAHAVAAPYAAHAIAAPVATSRQFHSQDELGAYSYGYAGALSAKSESKNALGGTVGKYSYIDANGIKQTVNYVADAAGFRVQATNLPVAPAAAALRMPVNTLLAPMPVDDTPEVKAAKAEFAAKYAAAAQAAADAPDRKRRAAVMAMPNPVMDTPSVMAAKAEHAMLYNAAALRAAGMAPAMPVVPLDTPAVMAAKARHAAEYNAAALRAAAAPDYGYWNNGLAMRSPLWNAGFMARNANPLWNAGMLRSGYWM